MEHTTDAARAFSRLVDTVRQLRGPDGCPWDRAQTLRTLRPFVLEETYELLDALDRNDLVALREELGDFLFEGVLLAQVCTDEGVFTVGDSLEMITDKLIRRHPHVFGPQPGSAIVDSQPAPQTADDVLGRWEAMKSTEASSSGTARTTLGGVPRALPALLRAHEIGSRASAVGFDWERASDVIAKIREEVDELEQALGDSGGHVTPALEEEMGDLLFALANLSRKLSIEPEAALRQANDKFTRRFTSMESSILASGRRLQNCTLDDMESEWQRVKATERDSLVQQPALPATNPDDRSTH